MDHTEMGCEDGRWMELAQGNIQWRALVLAILNTGFLLAHCLLNAAEKNVGNCIYSNSQIRHV
jgi:hypothetical protein